MKNIKKILSVVMIVAMMVSLVSCKSFKVVDDGDFEDAIEEIYDEEVYEISGDDLEYIGLDEYDMEKFLSLIDEDVSIGYAEFEDEEAARDFFEDEYYKDFEDMIDDGDFEGSHSSGLNNSRGYILFEGEADGDGEWEETDEIYGGIYWTENMVIMAIAYSDKKSDIEDMNEFLDMLGLPTP